MLNEIEILENHGHQISVLCTDLLDLGNSGNIGNIQITRFKMSNRQREILFGIVKRFPLYNWIWQRQIRKFIKTTGVEALHTRDLYMAKPVYAAKKHDHLPITVDLHKNFPAATQSYTWASTFPKNPLVNPKRWDKKEKRYLQYTDNIAITCENFKKRIMTKISGTYPKIKLLLIGLIDKGDQELFKSYMEDPRIKEQIIYHQRKDLSEFPSFVHQSSAGLSPLVKNPQQDSGIANKVFQYMLFETPVLVSDCTPQLELVKETRCGVVFKNQDVNDLVAKILYLYNHPEECEAMGEMGKKAVAEKYNPAVAGNKLNKLYRQ